MNQKLLFLFPFLILVLSCNIVSDGDSENIAKYGDSYLTKSVFLSMMNGFTADDSISKANYLINQWAIEKILNERARLNLEQSKLQNIESLVNQYRTNLLSEAYLEAIVNSTINLEIDSIEIEELYNKNLALFKLNEDIFKMVYIELPLNFSDIYITRSKIKRFTEEDKRFLDSVSYRFKNYSLNKDNWYAKNELLEQFPFINNYSYKSLKNYNFFQFKDSLSLYLIKIIESVNKGDISPIENVLPTLEYMSLNKRKKELMLDIKADILRDALQNNKLQIF